LIEHGGPLVEHVPGRLVVLHPGPALIGAGALRAPKSLRIIVHSYSPGAAGDGSGSGAAGKPGGSDPGWMSPAKVALPSGETVCQVA
jgi:hypothetical protein